MTRGELLSRLREWLGLPHTPDGEKRNVERRLAEQQRRLARIDAYLGIERRHRLVPAHPHRREGDR